MSGRMFQNVVLQLKENTDRTIGVLDGEGNVIACSELSMIGQHWTEYVPLINGAAGAMLSTDGKMFKTLGGWGNQFDYAAFTFGDNEVSRTACAMATVALNAAKSYYEEKHDRGSGGYLHPGQGTAGEYGSQPGRIRHTEFAKGRIRAYRRGTGPFSGPSE